MCNKVIISIDPTQLQPGDKVTGHYFGNPFVGIVEARKNHIFSFTIIRCEPSIKMDDGVRDMICIYDFQLHLPSLGCSLESVNNHAA